MALPDRRTLKISGRDVSIRQAGQGPDLVLLHGLAGNSGTWAAQFEAFAGDWRVTAWDAPGYGGSDTVAPDIDTYADRLEALVEGLDLKSFVLLGHSMGGVVAGRYAARYPARLRGLVLSCTLLGRAQQPDAPMSEGYRTRLTELETLPAAEYGARRARGMAAPDCDPAVLDRLAAVAAETRREGLESAMKMISGADNTQALASLSLPVLAITGEHDSTAPKTSTDAVAAAVASGAASLSERVIGGAGHAPYLENAAAYNAALSEFLAAL